MPVNHKEYLDVRDLADQMREAADEFEAQEFATPDDREDVVETLRAFYDLTVDLRNGATSVYAVEFEPDNEDFVNDMKAAAQELEDFQNAHGPTLIHEAYFVESIEELVEDAYGVEVKKMPPFLVIDWTATASNVRPNYFEVTLDGKTYLAEKG